MQITACILHIAGKNPHLIALLEEPKGVHVGGQVLDSRPAAEAHATDEEHARDGGVQEVRPNPAANPGGRRLQPVRSVA